MQYAWLIWSLVAVGIWVIVYFSLRNKESRKEMLIVSLFTSLLGITEPIFVPEYWSPPSLFNLARRTGFDIESFIFSFAIGGLAVVIYEWIFKTRHEPLPEMEKHHPRHWLHPWAILSAPIVFLVFYFFTNLNPIYSAVIALITGGVLTIFCRSDLVKKMLCSAVIFTVLYFFYFLTLIAMYPGYVEAVWNLPAISGFLIAGVPLEELIFAFSVGFLWSSVYEHFAWRKIKNNSVGNGII